MTLTRNTLMTLLVAMMALTAVVGPAAAQSGVQNNINPDADAAQNPYITTDVTVSEFDRSSMSVGEYEDNSGDIETLNATLNESDDADDLGSGTVNPYHFFPSDIEFEDAGAFPHDEDAVSAVHNESEWSTTTNGGSITVADASTASDVEALEISTSSVTSTDSVSATFSNFSVTSDVSKRYLQTIADVNTLETDANVEIRAVDSDGDYVDVRLNGSADTAADDVAATGTATGVVDQEQVGTLSVEGSGDGTMQEIQEVTVFVEDGNADLDISALNVEKSGEWVLGDEQVSDGDDGLETETVTDHAGGELQIDDLASMGVTFEDATIHGLTTPMNFRAVDAAGSDRVNVTFSEAPNYPSFDRKQTARYRLVLPDAYDLSYANAELRQESNLPNSRYQSVEILEGASDTDYHDLSGWTDKLDQIGSSGEDVLIDGTIQPGQEIAYKSVTLVTNGEASAVQNVDAVLGPAGSGDGLLSPITGFFGSIWGKITGILGGGALASRIFGGD